MKKHLVMVYGTLKRGYGNNHVLERNDAEFVATCSTVEPFAMSDTGIPYVLPASTWVDPVPSGRLKGELWRVDDEGLKDCDRLEGHPEFYFRTLTDIETASGAREKAFIYVYPRLHREGNIRYLQKPNGIGFLEWVGDKRRRRA